MVGTFSIMIYDEATTDLLGRLMSAPIMMPVIFRFAVDRSASVLNWQRFRELPPEAKCDASEQNLKEAGDGNEVAKLENSGGEYILSGPPSVD